MTVAKVCVRIPPEKKEELLEIAKSWRNTNRITPPGWDAKAIHRIAKTYYGSLENMFAKHGWPERGAKMMPAVQSRVGKTYGSIRNFVEKWEGQPNCDFPFGSWGKPGAVSSDPDTIVGPTDDALLDEMGL